jgi:hypothetical protein
MGGGHGEPELHSGGELPLVQAHTVADLVGYLGELPLRALGRVLGLGAEVLRRLQTLSRAARGKMWQIDQIRRRELGGARSVLSRRAHGDRPPMIDVVLHLAALQSDRALFDEFLQRFKSAKTPGDRQRFLAALGSFRNPDLMDRALRYSLTGPLRWLYNR